MTRLVIEATVQGEFDQDRLADVALALEILTGREWDDGALDDVKVWANQQDYLADATAGEEG